MFSVVVRIKVCVHRHLLVACVTNLSCFLNVKMGVSQIEMGLACKLLINVVISSSAENDSFEKQMASLAPSILQRCVITLGQYPISN